VPGAVPAPGWHAGEASAVLKLRRALGRVLAGLRSGCPAESLARFHVEQEGCGIGDLLLAVVA
jgi:hypothetical protein